MMKIPVVCLCSGQRGKLLKKKSLQWLNLALNLTSLSLSGLKVPEDSWGDRYSLSAHADPADSIDGQTPAAFQAVLSVCCFGRADLSEEPLPLSSRQTLGDRTDRRGRLRLSRAFLLIMQLLKGTKSGRLSGARGFKGLFEGSCRVKVEYLGVRVDEQAVRSFMSAIVLTNIEPKSAVCFS